MPSATTTERLAGLPLPAARAAPPEVLDPGPSPRTERLLSTVLTLLAPLAVLSGALQVIAEPRLGGVQIALVIAVAAIVIAWFLSRTGQYLVAGAITAMIPTVAGLIVFATAPDDPGWFAFMGLNPALGALFLTLRWAISLAIANLLAIAGAIAVGPAVDADVAIVAIMFNAIIATVLLAAAAFRDRLEHDRRVDLLARQELQGQILDGTFGGIAVFREGVVTEANAAFAEVVGQRGRDLTGARLDDVLVVDEPGALQETVDGAGCDPIEISARRRDGTRFDAEVVIRRNTSAHGQELVLAVRDVTDRKRADRALLGAQRLESVGRLAAGLVHDTNNELLVISALVEQLRRAHREAGLPEDDLDRIGAATERIATFTRRVLVVGRDRTTERDDIDVAAFVDHAASMWRQVLGTIELRLDVRETGLVQVDQASFEQVMLNLVLNARDAMPGDGCVTIQVDVETFDAGDDDVPMPPGRYQRISVADDGAGIPPDLLDHVFEPFFTTKEHDRGSGLGLYTAHTVVGSAGGRLTVASDTSGTEFTILLPMAPTVE